MHARIRRVAVLAAAALAAVCAAGCTATDQPVRVSRPALGTIVTIEAYGPQPEQVARAVDDAFDAITSVERRLDAHTPGTAVSEINASPYVWHELPAEATEIISTIDRLGVTDAFSPTLLGVLSLYRFEAGGRVPSADEIGTAVRAARSFERDGDRVRFVPIDRGPTPGIDLGGAAKGFALDRARDVLRSSHAVTAAILSAGSTTLTLGDKPDGEPWRVGIEDARDPGRVIAQAAWHGDAALSTSGDYQRSFERDGVRYHHIIDPATGRPARGARTLSVAGRISGLESDILSTALFVRGPVRALEYARTHGLVVHLTTSEGRTLIAPAPRAAGIDLTSD